MPLGHAMHFFLLLHRAAASFRSFHQLVGQALRHALLATLARGLADPAHGKRGAAHRADLDRNLVVGAAHATALHFHHWLHVVDRGVEHLEGILARLLGNGVERAVEDALGDGLLAARHEHVHELGDFFALVLRIRQDLAFGDFSTARHKSLSDGMLRLKD
jgi:hypothetical protein